MKAYITFYGKTKKDDVKVEWTIDEAKEKMKHKDFEKLYENGMIRNYRMFGYIA